MSDVVKARVMRGRLEWTVSAGAGGVVVARCRVVGGALRWRCDGVSVSDHAAIAERLPDEPDAWKQLGACRGMDPDAFFPDRGADPKPAQRICGDCPVTAECLDYAMERREIGIWGGTSERERRRMKRRARLGVSA